MTGQDIIIYDKAEVAFQAFLDGKLESSSVPNARIQEFISDSRVRRTPDSTTWRLNLNALKTVEAQQAQFPGSTFVPEPILGYTEFRQALFHIMDRKDLQDNWVPTSGIGITHFSSAYYLIQKVEFHIVIQNKVRNFHKTWEKILGVTIKG